MNNKSLNEERVIYIDFLRLFASLAIIVIHVCAQNMYRVNVRTISWHTFNLYDSFFRWGVPVFIMISGALFLGRDDIPIKIIYKRYVSRMLSAFVFWSVVYYLLGGNTVKEQVGNLFNTGSLICWITLIKGHYHLWFVPMIAGIYMCLPFFKKICAGQKLVHYFLILSFIFWSCIPTITTLVRELSDGPVVGIAESIYSVISLFDLGAVLGYVFYFVLGFFIANCVFSKKIRVLIYALGILGYVFTFLITSILSQKIDATNDVLYEYNCVNVVFQSTAVFTFIKELMKRHNFRGRLIAKLGRISFGAYLVHVLVIDRIERHLGFNSTTLHPIIAVPALTCAVFICAYAISFVLNKLPFIKKHFV